MKNISKRKIKQIARNYAASVVGYAMESGAYSELLSEKDNEHLQLEMKSIASKLSKRTMYGELDQIILEITTGKTGQIQ